MKKFYKKLVENKNESTENELSSDEEKWLDAFDKQIDKEKSIDIRLLSKKQRAKYLKQLGSKEASQKSSTEEEPNVLKSLPINNNLLSSFETDNEDEDSFKSSGRQKYISRTKYQCLPKFSKNQTSFTKDKKEISLEAPSPKDYISIKSSSSEEHITIKSSSSENKDKNIIDLTKSDTEESFKHEDDFIKCKNVSHEDHETSFRDEDTREPLVSNCENICSSDNEISSPKNTQIPVIYSARGKNYIRNYIYFCSKHEDLAYDADDERSTENEDEDVSMKQQYKIRVKDFALEKNAFKTVLPEYKEQSRNNDLEDKNDEENKNIYRPLKPESSSSSSDYNYLTDEDKNKDEVYLSPNSENYMLTTKEKRIYALLEYKENASKNQDEKLPSIKNESLVENVLVENKCPEENLLQSSPPIFFSGSEKSFKSANSGSSEDSVSSEQINITSGGKFIPKNGKYYRSGGKFLPSQHDEQGSSKYVYSDTEHTTSPSDSECLQSKSTILPTEIEKSYISISPVTSYKSALSGNEEQDSFKSVLSKNLNPVSNILSSSDESKTVGPSSTASDRTRFSVSIKSSEETFHSISTGSFDESNSNNRNEIEQSTSACSLASSDGDKMAENIALLLKVEVPKQERFFTLYSGQKIKFKSADNAIRIARLIECFEKARCEDKKRKAEEKKKIKIKPIDTPSTSKITKHTFKKPRLCAICGKEKKYVCAKTNVAVCSLECYKENLTRQEQNKNE